MAYTNRRVLIVAALAVLCANADVNAQGLVKDPHTHRSCGGASWYALHSKTASGERMNASLMTAAHRNLTFGTKLKVTNQTNGRSVVVRINDRGPFIRGRVLDLSKGAAGQIGMGGTANVCYEVVS